MSLPGRLFPYLRKRSISKEESGLAFRLGRGRTHLEIRPGDNFFFFLESFWFIDSRIDPDAPQLVVAQAIPVQDDRTSNPVLEVNYDERAARFQVAVIADKAYHAIEICLVEGKVPHPHARDFLQCFLSFLLHCSGRLLKKDTPARYR